MRRRLITDADYERLDMLLHTSSGELRESEIRNEFCVAFLSADVRPQKDISHKVITMNTRVRLKELNSNREIEVTITFPRDANSHESKISVFSRVGFALLGRVLGDIITWPIPGGVGEFEIIEVAYQPEAVGDYDL